MPALKRPLADVPPGQDAALAGRDATILGTVRRALEVGEVMLAYQPVMQARAPHEVAFHEGLLRVLDETGPVIPAGQFIAKAEHSDLGRELDCQALRMGSRRCRNIPICGWRSTCRRAPSVINAGAVS